MRIQFTHVGADNLCWCSNLPTLEHQSLLHAVKVTGALDSDNVHFRYDHHTQKGRICDGRLGRVGEFDVIETRL